MEKPLLDNDYSAAKERLEEIKMEIRFLNNSLEQLEDLYEEFRESNTWEDESAEKVREGKNIIKSIQLLFNDFKRNNNTYATLDEFKRSEREFRELIDVFNMIVNPEIRRMSDATDQDTDDQEDENSMSNQQKQSMMMGGRITEHQFLDLEEIVKDRDSRIISIHEQAKNINSLATEINHDIFRQDNILDSMVKKTEDSNKNLLNGNKE